MNVALLLLFWNVFEIRIKTYQLIAGLLINFIAFFFVVKFFLETVIFRKIKLLYKVIADAKKSLPGENQQDIILSQSINEIQDDVDQWANQTKQEISSLKSLETYRKKYLGDISHELKTPLFAIQGYLHTLAEGGIYDQKINMKYMRRALKNSERLQYIIEDLELINQLDNNKDILMFQEFDIKKLTDEILQELEVIAQEDGVKLSYKAGADNAYIVFGDREKIRIVISNLVTNSIKYGKPGGLTKLSFYDMDNMILVEISDNGIGIEDKHLKHLFDRFYRVDPSRSRKQGGSGLGLSIVKHIIEAHEGQINVRSTINVGSTFGFTLKKATTQR